MLRLILYIWRSYAKKYCIMCNCISMGYKVYILAAIKTCYSIFWPSSWSFSWHHSTYHHLYNRSTFLLYFCLPCFSLSSYLLHYSFLPQLFSDFISHTIYSTLLLSSFNILISSCVLSVSLLFFCLRLLGNM